MRRRRHRQDDQDGHRGGEDGYASGQHPPAGPAGGEGHRRPKGRSPESDESLVAVPGRGTPATASGRQPPEPSSLAAPRATRPRAITVTGELARGWRPRGWTRPWPAPCLISCQAPAMPGSSGGNAIALPPDPGRRAPAGGEDDLGETAGAPGSRCQLPAPTGDETAVGVDLAATRRLPRWVSP